MGAPMTFNSLTYNVTFQDFRFLQGYMTRRIFARNRADYLLAMVGVVLCAIFLALTIVVNVAPYRAAQIFGAGIRSPLSTYLILILLLTGAIASLVPAAKLRFRTLRMQVSDDGPYLGMTRLAIEVDGLTIDRKVMKTKYLWDAFQGVEIAKDAVILPIDNGIGLIIPPSAFASDAARYEFAATVSKRLPPNKSR
jgi:uncharacterized integral membrane protein